MTKYKLKINDLGERADFDLFQDGQRIHSSDLPRDKVWGMIKTLQSKMYFDVMKTYHIKRLEVIFSDEDFV